MSVGKAALLSALTIDEDDLAKSMGFQEADSGNDISSFAAADIGDAINLSDVSVGVFTQALENIATLRADNGGTMSRLNFASDNIATSPKPIWRQLTGGLSMSMWQPKAPSWLSTMFLYRRPHRCLPRPTLITISHSCYLGR